MRGRLLALLMTLCAPLGAWAGGAETPMGAGAARLHLPLGEECLPGAVSFRIQLTAFHWTERRFVQRWKVPPYPSVDTLSGIVTEVRLLQPANADSPMSVIPLGMTTEVRPVQSSKALSPIPVTV